MALTRQPAAGRPTLRCLIAEVRPDHAPAEPPRNPVGKAFVPYKGEPRSQRSGAGGSQLAIFTMRPPLMRAGITRM